MYIYEPWVPWRVAAEQKATRGLRKTAAAAAVAAMVVAAERFGEMVDNASCETEAPGPCAAQKTFKLIPPGLFQ